jgi:hypothetical protein
MTQDLKPGSRWCSAVCETEVVVVRLPTKACVLGCGGAEMAPLGSERSPDALPGDGLDEGTKLGKRYDDAATGIEVLCTKGGQGSLTVNGELVAIKESKPLPSSD